MARRVSARRAPTARRYTEEFKRDAVALLQSSKRPVAAVAKELGISDMTLKAWAKEAAGSASAQSEAERKEAAALRKRIKELEQEIDILKKFTAYWVKEGGE
jgi:transposase